MTPPGVGPDPMGFLILIGFVWLMWEILKEKK